MASIRTWFPVTRYKGEAIPTMLERQYMTGIKQGLWLMAAALAVAVAAQIGVANAEEPSEELHCDSAISFRDLTWQPYKSDVKAGRVCEPYGPPRPLEPRACQWGDLKGVQFVFTDENGQLVQALPCRPDRDQDNPWVPR